MNDTLGKTLSTAREKRGLAVNDVARMTRVNPKFIVSAEEDRFDLLPGDVFIKGFLRSYAKVLGLDADNVVARYVALGLKAEDNAPQLISEPLKPSSWMVGVKVFLSVIVAALAFGVTFYYSRSYNRDSSEQYVPAQVKNLVHSSPSDQTAQDRDSQNGQNGQTETPAPQDQQPVSGAEQRTPDEKSANMSVTPPMPPQAPLTQEIQRQQHISAQQMQQQAQAQMPQQTQPKQPPSSTPAPQTDMRQSQAASAPTPPTKVESQSNKVEPAQLATENQRDGVSTVTVSADRDTWMRVIVDGKTTKELILREGKSVSYDGELGFSLSLGNARGAHVFLNGKAVQLPATKTNVITNFPLPAE